jgi:alpha-galactosidase/6-phospho-beta-glucosidase family protein
MHPESEQKSALRIDVAGFRHATWTRRAKAALVRGLKLAFKKLSSAPINPETKETVGDEAKKLTAKSLKHAEARLDAPSIENQHKVAEIEKSFDEREKLRAETAKTSAETEKVRAETVAQKLANAEKTLELIEKLKAFEKRTGKKLSGSILGESGDEIVIVPKSLTAFLEEKVSESLPSAEEGSDSSWKG